MIYAVYFVPAPGAHPCNGIELYDQLWPIMLASVHRIGGKLVHITDEHTPSRGDSVFRVPVDPATMIYSRDVAWTEFLRSIGDQDEAAMIEPDTYMLRPVPRIRQGCDAVLLTRASKQVPGWFKIGTRRAVPLWEAVVREYSGLSPEQHVFHGDIVAMHRALGIGEGKRAAVIPEMAHGVRIESRPWTDYGLRKGNQKTKVFLQYKGKSKSDMLGIRV